MSAIYDQTGKEVARMERVSNRGQRVWAAVVPTHAAGLHRYTLGRAQTAVLDYAPTQRELLTALADKGYTVKASDA